MVNGPWHDLTNAVSPFPENPGAGSRSYRGRPGSSVRRLVDPAATSEPFLFYRAVVFAAPTNLVFIPPGTFRMGSPTNEVDRGESEGPQTMVTVNRGFWMGKYAVTQGEYLAVMGNKTTPPASSEPFPRTCWT